MKNLSTLALLLPQGEYHVGLVIFAAPAFNEEEPGNTTAADAGAT